MNFILSKGRKTDMSDWGVGISFGAMCNLNRERNE